jgi:phosphate transport system permease protein
MSRLLKNRLFITVSWISLSLCCLVLIFLFTVIAWNGVRAVNFDFLMTESRNFGAAGGIYYQIFGSILMVIVTAMISLPLALGTAIYKSEYLKNARLHRLSNIMIYGLNGIPSIIFGIFGFIFFVNIMNTGISWFVGSVIL